MTEFEKKIIEQNEQMIKNQETLMEMFSHLPNASMCPSALYAFLKPYYKHHNMPLEPLEKLLKDEEEPHEKQQSLQEVQSDFVPLGGVC